MAYKKKEKKKTKEEELAEVIQAMKECKETLREIDEMFIFIENSIEDVKSAFAMYDYRGEGRFVYIPGVPKKMHRLYNVISPKTLNLTSSNFLQ